MQLGLWLDVKDAEIARAAGFDFMECMLTTLLGDQDDEAFGPVQTAYRQSALPVRAFNVFLPRDLKVVGPEIDQPRLRRYTERALARAASLGARVIVFGSGPSRRRPDGYSREAALDQVCEFLHWAADVAEGTGLTIAIEPLNRRQCNLINTIGQAVEVARTVSRPQVRVLADFYHMEEEQEPLSELLVYKDWIAHIHLADTGGMAPGTGNYPYAEFAAVLQQAGYTGMLSLECSWNDLAAEAGPCCQFLRNLFQ